MAELVKLRFAVTVVQARSYRSQLEERISSILTDNYVFSDDSLKLSLEARASISIAVAIDKNPSKSIRCQGVDQFWNRPGGDL